MINVKERKDFVQYTTCSISQVQSLCRYIAVHLLLHNGWKERKKKKKIGCRAASHATLGRARNRPAAPPRVRAGRSSGQDLARPAGTGGTRPREWRSDKPSNRAGAPGLPATRCCKVGSVHAGIRPYLTRLPRNRRHCTCADAIVVCADLDDSSNVLVLPWGCHPKMGQKMPKRAPSLGHPLS